LGNPGERNHMEDPDDGRIILRWIFHTWDRGMDWIYLVPNMERWRALLNLVMNLRFPLTAVNFLTRFLA
jgi:hypothetical protein